MLALGGMRKTPLPPSRHWGRQVSSGLQATLNSLPVREMGTPRKAYPRQTHEGKHRLEQHALNICFEVVYI